MTLRQDLIATRALINTPRKWRKGALHSNGRYCVLGACDAIAPRLTDRTDRLVKALGAANTSGSQILVFNDAPTTSHADIMALFDRAINSAALDELRKPVDEVRE